MPIGDNYYIPYMLDVIPFAVGKYIFRCLYSTHTCQLTLIRHSINHFTEPWLLFQFSIKSLIEAPGLGVEMLISLGNMADDLAVMLPGTIPNIATIVKRCLHLRDLRIRCLTRYWNKALINSLSGLDRRLMSVFMTTTRCWRKQRAMSPLHFYR